MPFDIVVLDENFKFIGEARLDPGVHGMLWRKIVNTGGLPEPGKGQGRQRGRNLRAGRGAGVNPGSRETGGVHRRR